MSILALASDTLVGTAGAGQIEYNGQFFGTDSNASRAQLQRITSGTAVASTSGTSIDFTGIPAWVKRVTVMFAGVSTNGTSFKQMQLGTVSGVVTTGYKSSCSLIFGSNSTVVASATTGFLMNSDLAAEELTGQYVFTLLGSNLYVGSTIFQSSTNTRVWQGAGQITLAGALDRVRITTVNGTDTFDLGSVNILYEG
jgi:hypothetical protein